MAFFLKEKKKHLILVSIVLLAIVVLLVELIKNEPDDISFSVPSGFYNGEIAVEIYSRGDYELRYTLDSTEPTLSSKKYDGGVILQDASTNENIYSARTDTAPGFVYEQVEEQGYKIRRKYYQPETLVDKANILRVASFDSKGRIVEEKTATYFVDLKDKDDYSDVLIASITTDPKNLFDYEEGVYVLGERWDKGLFSPNKSKNYSVWNANYKYTGDLARKDGHVEIFDKEGDLLLSENGKLRIRGNLSRSNVQKSLGFKFETPRRVLTENKEDEIEFFAGGQDEVPKIEDYMTHELLRDKAYKVETFDMHPIQVFLDGEYWGMYYLQDVYTPLWLNEKYGVREDNIVVIKGHEVKVGLEEDYDSFKDFLEYIETAETNLENYEYVGNIIDIDSFIDFFAIQLIIGNTDFTDDGGNAGLWKPRIADNGIDAKYRFMVFDLNGHDSFNTRDEEPFEELLDENRLFSFLMNYDEIQDRMAGKIRELSEDTFSPDRCDEFLDDFVKENSKYIYKTNERFFTSDADEEFDEKVSYIREFFTDREDVLDEIFVDYYGKSLYDYNYDGELICH